ncbi:hypothetical protein SNEBB_008461 [Seison nebaliae]|nr:hypothetical protein SNEBB_008461 [Seison nebaliae]
MANLLLYSALFFTLLKKLVGFTDIYERRPEYGYMRKPIDIVHASQCSNQEHCALITRTGTLFKERVLDGLSGLNSLYILKEDVLAFPIINERKHILHIDQEFTEKNWNDYKWGFQQGANFYFGHEYLRRLILASPFNSVVFNYTRNETVAVVVYTYTSLKDESNGYAIKYHGCHIEGLLYWCEIDLSGTKFSTSSPSNKNNECATKLNSAFWFPSNCETDHIPFTNQPHIHNVIFSSVDIFFTY